MHVQVDNKFMHFTCIVVTCMQMYMKNKTSVSCYSGLSCHACSTYHACSLPEVFMAKAPMNMYANMHVSVPENILVGCMSFCSGYVYTRIKL